MADTPVSGLTEDNAPVSTDIVYYTKDPGGTPVSRKVQIGDLTKGLDLTELGQASGNIILQPVAGGSFSVIVSAGGAMNFSAGDFVVNTNQLFVEQSTGRVGLGTATPLAVLDLNIASGNTIIRWNRTDQAQRFDQFISNFAMFYEPQVVEGNIRFRNLANQDTFTVDNVGGSITIGNSFATTMTGDLKHQGTNIGFYNATPTAQDTGWTPFANASTLKTVDVTTGTLQDALNILNTFLTFMRLRGDIGT